MSRESEPSYCRLEYVDFSPKGFGLGVRHFGTLAKRLRSAGFSRITLEAAGDAGSLYNGYITCATFGVDLLLTPELAAGAQAAGFHGVRSTHDLLRSAEGRRWWIENGRTTEGVFDLARESVHTEWLEEYMMMKGVDLT